MVLIASGPKVAERARLPQGSASHKSPPPTGEDNVGDCAALEMDPFSVSGKLGPLDQGPV